MFVLPEERSMPFCELMDIFETRSDEADARPLREDSSSATSRSARSELELGAPHSATAALTRCSDEVLVTTSTSSAGNNNYCPSLSPEVELQKDNGLVSHESSESCRVSCHRPVYYVQKQNGYFPVEYPPLVADVPTTIPWVCPVTYLFLCTCACVCTLLSPQRYWRALQISAACLQFF